MAKCAVVAFRPRVIDCDRETKELLGALLDKAERGELAGTLVTYIAKDGAEQTCVSGLLSSDRDKAIAASTRATTKLASV